jgi:hypothetical protein
MTNIHKFLTRGGPSTADPSNYIGKPGEITFNSNTATIVVHDGITLGGTVIGGSLSGFTSNIDTSGINNTVNLSILLASQGTTNQDIAIIPSGTGSFSLTIPTGDSIGGNKRGNRAVDLQIFESGKNSATQIASGWHSFACGIANTSSGDYSFSSGWQNTSTDWASHSEGQNNTSSGTASHAEGSGNSALAPSSHAEGFNNTTTGYASHAEGSGNVVSADYGHAEGYQTRADGAGAHAEGFNTIANGLGSNASGYFSTTRGMPFAQSYATHHFNGLGDSQTLRMRLNALGIQSTVTRLTVDFATPNSTNQLPIPTDCSSLVNGKVIAKDVSSGNTAAWSFSACLKNVSGTVSVVGVPVFSKDFADTGAPTDDWTIGIGADDTYKCFYITGAGSTGVTTYWSCEVWSQEIIGSV